MTATDSESVIDGVRRLILSRQYASGDRLDEVELAATLGVSLTLVREALRRSAGPRAAARP